MSESNGLVERLRARFQEKIRRNGRYSLRAFARDLGISHSHLSRVLRNQKQLSPAQAKAIEESSRPTFPPTPIAEWRLVRALEILIATGGATTRALSRELSSPTTIVSSMLRSLVGRGWVGRKGGRWETKREAERDIFAAIEAFHARSVRAVSSRLALRSGWAVGEGRVMAFTISLDAANWKRVWAAFLRFQRTMLQRFHDASKPDTHGVSLRWISSTENHDKKKI